MQEANFMVQCTQCQNQFDIILSYGLCYNCWPNYVWPKIIATAREPKFSIDSYYFLPERRTLILAFLVKYQEWMKANHLKAAELKMAYCEATTDRFAKKIFIQLSHCERAFSWINEQVALQPELHWASIEEFVLCDKMKNFNKFDYLSDNLNSPKIQMCRYELYEIVDSLTPLLKNAPSELNMGLSGKDGREHCSICQNLIFFQRRAIVTNRCGSNTFHKFHASCLIKHLGTVSNPLLPVQRKGCPVCNAKIDLIHGYEPSKPFRLPPRNGEDCARL